MKPIVEMEKHVKDRRDDLVAQKDCVVIDSDEFCRLAVSNQMLIRIDEPKAQMKGFAESDTGIRYLIENEKLSVLGI